MLDVCFIGRNFIIQIPEWKIINSSKYLSLLYNFNVKSGLYKKYSFIPIDLPNIYSEQTINKYINIVTGKCLSEIDIDFELVMFLFFIQTHHFDTIKSYIYNNTEKYSNLIQKIHHI